MQIQCRVLWRERIAGSEVNFSGKVGDFERAWGEAESRRKAIGWDDLPIYSGVMVEARPMSEAGKHWSRPWDTAQR